MDKQKSVSSLAKEVINFQFSVHFFKSTNGSNLKKPLNTENPGDLRWSLLPFHIFSFFHEIFENVLLGPVMVTELDYGFDIKEQTTHLRLIWAPRL